MLTLYLKFPSREVYLEEAVAHGILVEKKGGLEPNREVSAHEIPNMVDTPAVYDEDFNVIQEATYQEGFFVNLRVSDKSVRAEVLEDGTAHLYGYEALALDLEHKGYVVTVDTPEVVWA